MSKEEETAKTWAVNKAGLLSTPNMEEEVDAYEEGLWVELEIVHGGYRSTTIPWGPLKEFLRCHGWTLTKDVDDE